MERNLIAYLFTCFALGFSLLAAARLVYLLVRAPDDEPFLAVRKESPHGDA